MKEMLPGGAADQWCQKVKGRRLRAVAENQVLEVGRGRREGTRSHQGSLSSGRRPATGKDMC